MPRSEAILGFRAHSGWAVAIAVSDEMPVLRRRIEMVKGTGFRARQPYHAAEEMKLEKAEAFLKQTEELAVEMASAAVADLIAKLRADGYTVKRAVVLEGSGKPLPELSKILAAHPLIHTAEGVFFREVLKKASVLCGLSVSGVRERDLPAPVVARFSAKDKSLGPPWTQDEKLAAAATAQ